MSTAIAPRGIYLPRHPERTPLHRMLDDDFERVVRVYDERFEHQYGFLRRIVTRAPLRLDAMELLANGRVRVLTPVHPQTGSTRMELDVLEMIRRLCAQIPDSRQHMVTYYGWCSHRARGERRKAAGETPTVKVEVRVSTPRSRSWARLMRRIFEVDPLLCPQCQVEMKVVSVIQEKSSSAEAQRRPDWISAAQAPRLYEFSPL